MLNLFKHNSLAKQYLSEFSKYQFKLSIMKKLIIFILLFSFFKASSQNILKDTIYVQYEEGSELIKMIKHKDTDIRSFGILLDIYKNKRYRDSIAKEYWKRGGQTVPLYIGFTGEKNHMIQGNLKGFELTTIQDISKLKVILGYGQKVFFIKKIGCNSYIFHETHKTYE